MNFSCLRLKYFLALITEAKKQSKEASTHFVKTNVKVETIDLTNESDEETAGDKAEGFESSFEVIVNGEDATTFLNKEAQLNIAEFSAIPI